MNRNTGNKAEGSICEQLVSFMIDDILETSDEEILAEAKEDGIDIEEEVSHVKTLLEKAHVRLKKMRLEEARRGLDARGKNGESQKDKNVSLCDPAMARKKIEDMSHQSTGFTLAARKGQGISDSDAQSIAEDIDELERFQPTKAKDDKEGET